MIITPTEKTPLRVRIWMQTRKNDYVFLAQSYGAYDPFPETDGDVFIVWTEDDIIALHEFFGGLIQDEHDTDPDA